MKRFSRYSTDKIDISCIDKDGIIRSKIEKFSKERKNDRKTIIEKRKNFLEINKEGDKSWLFR